MERSPSQWSSEREMTPASAALLTAGAIMFVSGVTASVLTDSPVVTVPYYVSTLAVVSIGLSLGLATLWRRRGRAAVGSSSLWDRVSLVGLQRRCRALVSRAVDRVPSPTSRDRRERL